MQVVGFNFSKISASKEPGFKPGPISTNIEFVDLQKEKVAMLNSEAVKVFYKFSLDYMESEDKKSNKLAELNFEGNIMLSVNKDESKDLTKAWKKKKLPSTFRVSLFNLILKKTAPKALQLQDELSIPSHVPVQQLQIKQGEQ